MPVRDLSFAAAFAAVMLGEQTQTQMNSSPTSLYPRRTHAVALLCGLWLVIFFSALFGPSLLDDADATHANAARHMLTSGDWVTLKVNGIRYLEKAPLPYWLVAISFSIFGFNTFAAHLPQAIGVLLLALLGYQWAAEAFGLRAAFYAGVGLLTSAGTFLFTRIFIPEVWLSLFLAAALYCLLKAVRRDKEVDAGADARWAYALWSALALAVLTKGLVALVFFFGAACGYLAITGEYRLWRRLRPFTGALLFLAIAAPWHVLAGVRNRGGSLSGHPRGFFWFYFVNEHFLRFLGRRVPMDYNKLPGWLFWGLHLVWLFPWSLFAPLAAIAGWRLYRHRRMIVWTSFTARTALLLGLYSALVLVFFSLSTNQEYYTFPAYLSLLMLMMAALAGAEDAAHSDEADRRWLGFAHAAFTVLGVAIAGTLAYGLWASRRLAFVPDIGNLLAHRGVGDYTLSMSHLFDLTGPSFAALRLPAGLAALAFAVGPAVAWRLRHRGRDFAATMAVAMTTTVFLIAAHIALVRFGPMLSSAEMAATIVDLRATHGIGPEASVLLYGDQAYGSSIPFYLGQQVPLVEGRSTSMLFGSSFPDAPKIFLSNAELLAEWGQGPRKVLFVPLEKRDAVDRLLGGRQVVLMETSGKALITDRPLDRR